MMPGIGRPQPRAEAFHRPIRCSRLVHAVADVDTARAEFGEDRPVAASADIERRSEGAAMTMTAAPVTAEAMPATVHAVSAAMATTMPAGRSRCDVGSGQGECGDGREGNPAKHFVFSVLRHDCLIAL